MKKILSIWLIVALLIGTTVPAFAVEDNEGGETTVGDSVDPDTGTGEGSESGDVGGDSVSVGDTGGDTGDANSESSEGSDGGSEPPAGDEVNESSDSPKNDSGASGGGSVVSLDGATVNVSQESVLAIADAVNTTTNFSVTNKDGDTFDVPSEVANVWGNYEYLVHWKRSGGTYWTYSIKPLVFDTSKLAFTSSAYTYEYFNGEFSRLYSGGLSIYTNSVILWSNYDILDSDSLEVYYRTDMDSSFNVSFFTGFDDLILDDVLSTDFVVPSVSYTGYRFDGWFLDSAYTLPYTSGYEFLHDTTLYAKWTPYRTVNFTVLGIEGLTFDSVYVIDGEPYTPPDFSYSGYEYLGAYTDANCENTFVGGTVISDDTTLYLRFEPIVYDYGALAAEQNKRLEALLYVQMAQGVILAVVLIGNYFFHRRSGLGV